MNSDVVSCCGVAFCVVSNVPWASERVVMELLGKTLDTHPPFALARKLSPLFLLTHFDTSLD